MDYYWNGFTDLQRASNRIVFRPGKPPWQAIMIPISPEWGLVRGIVLDGMNELYGYNRVGSLKEMAERGELEWLQTHVGLARVADVPLLTGQHMLDGNTCVISYPLTLDFVASAQICRSHSY